MQGGFRYNETFDNPIQQEVLPDHDSREMLADFSDVLIDTDVPLCQLSLMKKEHLTFSTFQQMVSQGAIGCKQPHFVGQIRGFAIFEA